MLGLRDLWDIPIIFDKAVQTLTILHSPAASILHAADRGDLEYHDVFWLQQLLVPNVQGLVLRLQVCLDGFKLA